MIELVTLDDWSWLVDVDVPSSLEYFNIPEALKFEVSKLDEERGLSECPKIGVRRFRRVFTGSETPVFMEVERI